MAAVLVPYLGKETFPLFIQGVKGAGERLSPPFAEVAELLPAHTVLVTEAEVENVGTVNHGTVGPSAVIRLFQRPINQGMLKIDPDRLVIYDGAVYFLTQAYPEAGCTQTAPYEIPVTALNKGMDTEKVAMIVRTRVLDCLAG